VENRWQVPGLVVPVFIVEIASFFHLSEALQWFYPPPLAYTTALALIFLLLAGIVALGQSLTESIRNRLLISGAVLYSVQALANVCVCFQWGLAHFPTQVPGMFFGTSDTETIMRVAAIISGGVLSVTSIVFWQILGHMLHRSRLAAEERKAVLVEVRELIDKEAI
jgi:hypothetical protein